jgi:ATP-binding cassette subfamily B protein
MLLRLRPYAREQWRWLCTYMLVLIVSATASAAVPLGFRRAVDDGLAVGDNATALRWATLAWGLGLAAAAATACGGWLGATLGMNLAYRLRIDLYRHMCEQPLSFFARSQAGALASRINNDAIDAQALVQSLLGTLVGQGMTLIVALVAMYALDPWAVLVIAVASPTLLLPTRLFARRVHLAARRQATARSDIQHHLSEHLNSQGALARIVFGSRQVDITGFDRAANEMKDAVNERNANFYASSFFLNALSATGVASVYAVASSRGAHSVSVGTVVALAGLALLVFQPLTQLATQGLGISSALVGLERVFEVLDFSSGQASSTQHRAPTVSPPGRPVRSLQLRHVWFHHPGTEATLASLAATTGSPASNSSGSWVLQDLSLELTPGTTALVGATGAGKTTTAMLACAVYQPTRGQILLDGVDLRSIDPTWLRRTIGVVNQDPFLLHATLRENLQIAAPHATDSQMTVALERALLQDLLADTRAPLDTLVGDRGYRLSGGERQRLSLARLLLTYPDVVILDEATAHLDNTTEQAIADVLRDRLEHSIRLVIAHRLTTIQAADKIVVLDSGRIIEQGTHTHLISNGGAYAKLWTDTSIATTAGPPSS